MLPSAGPAMTERSTKRRFDDESAEGEVELTLKRKKQRILPIRTTATTAHHAVRRQDPAPDDSPILCEPEPPTLTPAESDDGAVDGCPNLNLSLSPSSLPTISTEGLLPRRSEDHDMDDDLSPMPSPALSLMISPLVASSRLPTPRYGSFCLRPPAQHAGCDVTMGGADETISRALGMSSLNPVVENRLLPSPINEISPRQGVDVDGDYEADEGRMNVALRRRTDDATLKPPTQVHRGPRTARPMLVMGYRVDCERCRARVPGHYSHIVRA